MSANQKDKRTKEQILKLLDKAIEQEERLSEKIKSLETELAECRKKAEDPRAELTDDALPSSKVSFRLDYYRTAKNGPLKGIIEHLPSRETKVFEGEGRDAISQFMSRFVSEEKGAVKKKKSVTVQQTEKMPTPKVPVLNTKTESPIVEAVPHEEQTHEANTVERMEKSKPERLSAPETPKASSGKRTEIEFVVSEKLRPDIVVHKQSRENRQSLQPEAGKRPSRLLERLKAGFASEIEQFNSSSDREEPASTESAMRIARIRRLIERSGQDENTLPDVQTEKKGQIHSSQAARLSLIERLRLEYKNEQSAN
ncbi:MAG: hypothetical protein OHK0019_27150 [Saprospiraceae bacterium]